MCVILADDLRAAYDMALVRNLVHLIETLPVIDIVAIWKRNLRHVSETGLFNELVSSVVTRVLWS